MPVDRQATRRRRSVRPVRCRSWRPATAPGPVSGRHDAGSAAATGRRTGSRRADGTGRQPPIASFRPWAAHRDNGATWRPGAERLSGCCGCCRRGSAWRHPAEAVQPGRPGYRAPAAFAGHSVEGARVPAPRGPAGRSTSYRSSVRPQPPGRSARPSPVFPKRPVQAWRVDAGLRAVPRRDRRRIAGSGGRLSWRRRCGHRRVFLPRARVLPTMRSWVSTRASARPACHSTAHTARMARRRLSSISRRPSAK